MEHFACKPSSVAREWRSSARAFVWRARAPWAVCSRMRMEVERRVLWVVRRVVRVFVRDVRAVARAWGRVVVAEVRRFSARVGRDVGVGGEKGEAIVQREVVMVWSWVESAEAIMSMLSMKKVMSPERISRSLEEGTWPDSRAETRSMQACSESGRVGARDGRVVRLLIRICVLRWVLRTVVRF